MSDARDRPPRMRYLEWAIREMPRARLDLATSGVPTVPPEELGAVAAMGEWQAHAELVKELAARYAARPEEIVPALGAAGGLWLLATVLAEAGDEICIEDPVYEPVLRVFEGRGAKVTRFRRAREDGFAIRAEAVLDAVGPRTRAVVVTNPHNPTGVHAGDEVLRPLAAALGARGVELVVDEVYRDLCEPRATARRLGDHVSIANSLTKCFGLGWARVGWVIARPALAERMRAATMHVAGVLPSTVGAIGAAALRELPRLEARARAAIAGKRDRVDAWIARHAQDLVWQAPHPGIHFGWVEDRRGRDLGELLGRALEERSVLAVPGRFFDNPSAFRMSWALPSALLDEALSQLGAALELRG